MVGAGAIGRHHVRILSGLEGASLAGLLDLRAETAHSVAEEFGTTTLSSIDDLVEQADAAVVAVPTKDHCEIGCELLHRGLHVLIEKPLASSLAEADRLLAAAEDRVLAVGHVEFFNPAVQALLRLGAAPGFVEIDRLAVFTPRSLDVDVVLDLMIHDLQILHALDESPVAEIRAAGVSVLSSRVDIANARVELESGCVANLTASRVSAERVRKLRAFLTSGYFSVDYQSQEVQGYRLGRGEGDGPRRIEPVILEVEKAEPLRKELEAFVGACRGGSQPLVDGRAGRRALATALSVAQAISLPAPFEEG